ncbi:MAG TPA: helix-turn-helix transcriptional regulator [Phycisphaerae bacterium]|nr:helix-turn-helix transcriptional regulator [Phycisphaerae bacterium]
MKPLHVLLNDMIGETPGREVARAIGKSQSYVSQIRSGEQVPTETTLARFAIAFGRDRLLELILATIAAQSADARKKAAGDGSAGEWAEMDDSLQRAVEQLCARLASAEHPAAKTAGRTLADFPQAFYPLTILLGDRRQDAGFRMTAGDLGAYSATPAVLGWINALQLRKDVDLLVDKQLLHPGDPGLAEHLADRNLLIVGSPAHNHYARRVNRTAIHRYNYPPQLDEDIERTLDRARGLSQAQLAAEKETGSGVLRRRMDSLFVGGILDPMCRPRYLLARLAERVGREDLDFGVLTFATNPFYQGQCLREGRENDHRRVAILASGIHHPATAHALRRLSADSRNDGTLRDHPYGGVLSVEFDPDCPPADRARLGRCRWEPADEESSHRAEDRRAALLEALTAMEKGLAEGRLRDLEMTPAQAADCRRLIEAL